MNFLNRMEQWGNAHHPKFMDIIRIVLGIFLCWKGFDYLRNMGELIGLMTARASSFDSLIFMLVGHYIVFAHMVGGFLLAIGLFTRFACLIQIPILLGAIFFINIAHDTFRPYPELFLSVIVLLLLIYFLIAGNGPWAVKFPEEEKKRSERLPANEENEKSF